MKYSVIDLFCGCGGLSEGFKLAGFNIVGGIDFNQKAIDTYKKNFKNATAICADLMAFNEKDIHTNFPNLNKVDVIIGGPPCQSWSEAGMMKGIEDARGQLFFDFIRMLKDKQPKFFVAENVSGMLSKRHEEAVNNIIKMFEDAGYNMHIKLLNANDYNVPQDRLRVFYIGFRKDLKDKLSLEDAFEKKLENQTSGDAVSMNSNVI